MRNDFIFYFRGIYGNVIVGAGAIVTKSIHDSGVYAGMPCKKLKKL